MFPFYFSMLPIEEFVREAGFVEQRRIWLIANPKHQQRKGGSQEESIVELALLSVRTSPCLING